MADTVVHVVSPSMDSISTDSDESTSSLLTACEDITEQDAISSAVDSQNGSRRRNIDPSQIQGSSPRYIQLKDTFKENNKVKFKTKLFVNFSEIDLNFKYEDDTTVLDLAKNMSITSRDILEEVVKDAMIREDRKLINLLLSIDRRYTAPFGNSIILKNIMTLLGKRKINVMSKTFTKGNTVCHLAAQHASLDLMEYMMFYYSFRKRINTKNDNGDTPFHCAARRGDFEIVSCLVHYGASITEMNLDGHPAFAALSPSQLESLLGYCITFENRWEKIRFNLDMFYGKYLEQERYFPVMPALYYINGRRDLRHLLQHPTLETLIKLKFSNMFDDLLCTNVPIYSFCLFSLNSMAFVYTKMSFDIALALIINILLLVTIFTFIMLDSLTFIIIPKNYFNSIDNCAKMFLFIFIGGIMLGFTNATLLSAAVFISWVVLFLIVGRNLRTRTSLQLLKTVSLNYFKCLGLYSILILAFAFGFHVLMRECNAKDKACSFSTVKLSIFKSIVMLMGEFDMSNIPFEGNSTVSYALFVLFEFMISIVLLTMLNGLAVSDTKKIISKAELLNYDYQIRIVSHIENIILVNHCLRFYLLIFCLIYIDTLNVNFNGYNIYFYRNDNNIIGKPLQDLNEKKTHVIPMGDNFVERAREIVIQRNANQKRDKDKESMDKVRKHLLKGVIKEVKEQLIEEVTKIKKDLQGNITEINKELNVEMKSIKNLLIAIKRRKTVNLHENRD